MNKEEKRRKFHDSLLKMLYPPPSPPPPQEHHQAPLNISSEDLSYDSVDEEEKLSSSSSDEEQQKLTRAQRKRLRKNKLRQAASQRRPIIGPLLPTTTPADNTPVCEAQRVPGPVLGETQPVRRNAGEESVTGIHNSDDLFDDKDSVFSSSSDVNTAGYKSCLGLKRTRLNKEKLRQAGSLCSSVIEPVLPSSLRRSNQRRRT